MVNNFQFWFGGVIDQWRMWGITFKTVNRWWFVGVSRQLKVTVDTMRI